MNTAMLLFCAAMLVACLLPGNALADLKEVDKGVLVEDFEGGNLEQLSVDPREMNQKNRLPEILRVEKEGGGTVLHLKGGGFHNRVYYQDQRFRDFSLQVRIKKTSGSYAGIVVRDHWRVYLQMKGYLCINSDLPEVQSKGELFKSDVAFTGYHDLKVVCAGPLLHVYVDGQPTVTYRISSGEGRVGLYSHGGGEAFYDNLRIDFRVAPEYYLQVEPEAPEGALVFAPGEQVALKLKVSNFSDLPRQLAVTASVRAWGGQAVAQQSRREVTAAAGGDSSTELDVGRMAAGFYNVELEARCDGKPVSRMVDLPLAIQHRGASQFKVPAIPVGAYYKYYCKKSPLYMNTYAHAAARSLKDHHFNAVVADPSFTREVVDIFQNYGIATISRGSAFLDHPAVIAALSQDEPKPEQIGQLRQEYDKLRQISNKPITTCMVGEGIGLGVAGDPVLYWRQLDARLRCFRWYGIKKSFYGPLHDIKYKGVLPLASVLRIVEASSDTPYWFVAPALGKRDHEAYYHKPTSAETSAMMHLALMYGVDGILFFAFQTHGTWPCFVDQQSLQPTDENYAAAAKVATLIETHADLLKALKLGGLDVRCPTPVVEARPLRDSRDEKPYVYAVNKDPRNSVSARLLCWGETWELAGAWDVYSGGKLKVEPRDEEGYVSVPLTLAPGEGKLLAMDVALKPRKP